MVAVCLCYVPGPFVNAAPPNRLVKVKDPAAGPEKERVERAVAAAPADVGRTAREILEQSGIQDGLIVHLGCGDGRLTAALRAGEGYLVHGLDRDSARRERAREHVCSGGLYGSVCIGSWDGRRLPHAENLVNLTVAQEPGAVAMEEMLRCLAPGGVAW